MAQLEQELAATTRERDTLRTQCDGLRLQLKRHEPELTKLRAKVRAMREIVRAAYDMRGFVRPVWAAEFKFLDTIREHFTPDMLEDE